MYCICMPVSHAALTDKHIGSPRDDQQCFVKTQGPVHAAEEKKTMPRPLPYSDHHLHRERLHDFIATKIRIATVSMFLPSHL